MLLLVFMIALKNPAMALERRDVVQWLKSLLCQPNALSSDAQATVNMRP